MAPQGQAIPAPASLSSHSAWCATRKASLMASTLVLRKDGGSCGKGNQPPLLLACLQGHAQSMATTSSSALYLLHASKLRSRVKTTLTLAGPEAGGLNLEFPPQYEHPLWTLEAKDAEPAEVRISVGWPDWLAGLEATYVAASIHPKARPPHQCADRVGSSMCKWQYVVFPCRQLREGQEE